jgi:hypothetical protein
MEHARVKVSYNIVALPTRACFGSSLVRQLLWRSWRCICIVKADVPSVASELRDDQTALRLLPTQKRWPWSLKAFL